MAITARSKVGDLLEEHPDLDEVFENYGIEISDELFAMTLKEVCKTEGINYWELKSDIVEAVGWDGTADGDLFDDEEEDEDEEGWGEDGDDLDLAEDEFEDDDDDDDDEEGGGEDEDEEGEEEEGGGDDDF